MVPVKNCVMQALHINSARPSRFHKARGLRGMPSRLVVSLSLSSLFVRSNACLVCLLVFLSLCASRCLSVFVFYCLSLRLARSQFQEGANPGGAHIHPDDRSHVHISLSLQTTRRSADAVLEIVRLTRHVEQARGSLSRISLGALKDLSMSPTDAAHSSATLHPRHQPSAES